MATVTKARVLEIARQCGFELAGIAAAAPAEDYARFEAWRGAGFAGEMSYLNRWARRHAVRSESIACLGEDGAMRREAIQHGSSVFHGSGSERARLDFALRLG